MTQVREFLIGGKPETDEQQRLRLLELVWKHLEERFGTTSPQNEATVEVRGTPGMPSDKSDPKESAGFSFSAIPELPEVSPANDSGEVPSSESRLKVMPLHGPRMRTQEDINRDLERLGLSIQNLASEKSRLEAEIDTWLIDNSMTPRTAQIYVEELVVDLRRKQIKVSAPEVRKHLWDKVRRR